MRRVVDDDAIGDRLRELGFVHVAPEKVRRIGGRSAGQYLRVCGSKGVPEYLSFSRDICAEAGIGKGTLLEVHLSPTKLAIEIGRGSLKLSKSGAGLRLTCPVLLAKLAAKDGEVFPAELAPEFEGKVIYADLGAERMKRIAEEGRRAQAARSATG